MTFAEINLSVDPAWPWSLPNVGVPAMFGVALALAALTVWTYAGVPKAAGRRLLAILALRLAALLIAFLALLRPSFGVTQLEGVEPSKLFVIFDHSASMNVADMGDSETRWQHLKRLWQSPAVRHRLDELAAVEKIEVAYYVGAEELRALQGDAQADGKRTDIGVWLSTLWQKHGHEKHVRGIVLCSDGADNGTRFSAQQEAGRWRGICPVTAFGFGNPSDPKLQKDIALTSLDVQPNPVSIKSMMHVAAKWQASGFEIPEVDLIVSIEDMKDKKPAMSDLQRKIPLKKQKDQPIDIDLRAPDAPGEYRVTLKIPPLPDEANLKNNEISTYLQVVKEKINILWVDRRRQWEPQLAIRTLKKDARFEVDFSTRPIDAEMLDRKQYDVIVIGDISTRQFGDDSAIAKLAELVRDRRVGLLMLGGDQTFGAGGWQNQAALMKLMPVDFSKAGFPPDDVRAKPTLEGAALPFLQLAADPKKNDKLWRTLEKLEGIAFLGEKSPGASILMETDREAPVLVAMDSGGRVAVFAGDSTGKRWLTPETLGAYEFFWKKLVLWMSQQKDGADNLWIKLERRRINVAAGETVGFAFGLRDKNGNDLPEAKFAVHVEGEGKSIGVTPIADGNRRRGIVTDRLTPGEYQLVVKGNAGDIRAEQRARFLVVADDIEMLRPVAEHDTLRKLAAAAGGRFFAAEETALTAYLDELKSQVHTEARHKTTQWPDWKRLPASDHTRDQLAGLWQSFGLVSFLLFTVLLGCEWLLRRMWGLV